MRIAATLALASVLLFPACGSDGPTSPRTGTLRVEMTDDPTDQLEEINVFITGLTVKHAQEPVERIADEIGLIDLLSLQDTTELLATANVEPGIYQFIRVDLDEERSNVLEIGAEQVDALDRLGFWEALGEACDVIIDDFEEDEVASKHVAKGIAVVCSYLGRPELGAEVERTLLGIEEKLELAHMRGASLFLAG